MGLIFDRNKLKGRLQLSYPTSNVHEGRIVSLRIEDRESSLILAEITLDAEQMVSLLATQMIEVEMAMPADLSRIGKTMVFDRVPLGRNPSDEQVATETWKAYASGWHVVRLEKSNQGKHLSLRKWVEKE